jgi:hypothetical protein
MAVNRKGFGAAVGGALKSKWRGSVEEKLASHVDEFFVGRVTDIILNQNHPKFKDYGEWNGIGTIFFEAQGNEFVGSNNIIAKPLSPQRSSFPLVNEMVLIFTLPNKEMGQAATSTSYFYINVISIWNSQHHNAYPNPILTSDLPPSQQKDYQQTSAGSTRKVTNEPKEIPLNSPINPSQNTFIEQSNIHPLLPFAGDIMYEGRFGNSIRFGSTAKNPPSPILNNWSINGENGNPITIIRNGQDPDSTETGWVPIVEDINKDLSSIYATSNQQIPLEVKNSNYDSYSTPPTTPDQYVEPQVIINSDRLVFNAKKDHVLISAKDSVFLGSNSSLNFSTKNYIVDAPDIKLGSNATEPLILGNKFLTNLNAIMTSLNALCAALAASTVWPVGVSVPNAPEIVTANDLIAKIGTFVGQIESYKSTVSKTE